MTVTEKKKYVWQFMSDFNVFLKEHGYKLSDGAMLEVPTERKEHKSLRNLMVSIRLPFYGLHGAFLGVPTTSLRKSCKETETSSQAPLNPLKKRKP
jgi:hypothetical protein